MKDVVITLCFTLSCLTGLLAQPGTNNLNFNPLDVKNGDRADDAIEAAALQPDGKVIIGGWFRKYDEIPVRGLARLDAEGNLDRSFKTGSGLHIAFAVAIQPDGRILVAGSFMSYNDTACVNIVRLLPNGAIDKSFQTSSGPDSYIEHMALQPDGKIIVTGYFSEYGGVTRNGIARLNSNGSLDLPFDPATGPNNQIHALTIQADSKILVGGDFTSFAGHATPRIARLNVNGTFDATFNPTPGINQAVRAITLQADGKILIGGSLTTVPFGTTSDVVRLNANGSFDAMFNPVQTTMGSVSCIVIERSGKILISGTFTGGIARLHSDGSIDDSFDPGTGTTDLWDNGSDIISSIIPLSDGRIIVTGDHRFYDGIRHGSISWIKQDGKLDVTSLQSTGANDTIFAVSPAADGKMFIGGGFSMYNGEPRKGLARIQPDGTVDETFNPMNDDEFVVVKAIQLQPDGKIIVGGIFVTKLGTLHPLRRFNVDGTVDATFDNVSGYAIAALAVQPDGKIIAGGQYLNHPGNLIRVLPDGSLDPSWNMPFGFDGSVHSVSLQPDGKIIVGGYFSQYQTGPSTWVSCYNIARLNTDGTLDPTFNPGTEIDFMVFTMAVQPDKKIILGGSRPVRLYPDGSIDDTFLPEVSEYSWINKIFVASDGKIIIAGQFSSVNGATRHNIARLRVDGTLDLTFDPGSGANDMIHDAAETNDNNILIAGTFTKFDGEVRTRVAKLWYKSPQTISFDVIPNVVIGSGPFDVHASSTSGLPVSFTTTDPEISISEDHVTPLSAGQVTIVARQNGDEVYSAADPIQKTFCVNPVKPTITIDATEPIDVKLVSSSDSHNQWYKEHTSIDGATAKVFAPLESGVYTVQVSVDGCSSDQSDGYTLLTTSAESFKAHIKTLAYPNPTSGKFISFSFEENGPSSVTISDVRGTSVLAVSDYKSKQPVSVESLSQGIYLALIETNKRRYWVRFTKVD